MAEHKPTQHGHGHSKAEHGSAKKKKMIHHDWRFWTAIVLMVLAMAAYVFSFDESLRPAGVDGPEVPIAAE
jgi:hypothetical protein